MKTMNPVVTGPLAPELLHRMDAYWRAANYLSVGQLYLYDNPLLKKPLELSHVKPLVVGHWGTTPGQNFIYVHLNRVIKKYDLDMFYIAGPGHGGPALVGQTYLEGTYSEIYPYISPVSDGAVLPILHLNGYKISNPTVLARIEEEELDQFLRGCGWEPHFVTGDDPEEMHQLMAGALEEAIEGIRRMQDHARGTGDATRRRWPMIVLRSPKGWTGPKVVDGLQVEGTFRSHQVPLLVDSDHLEHVAQLESWMQSYKPEELFDADGRLVPDLAELAPEGDRRMGANPHANGGALLPDPRIPAFAV